MTRSSVDLLLAATPASVRVARREIGELASALGAATRTVDDVRLCVTEAVANAVVHAYGGKGGRVEVTADVSGAELVVLVRDHGTGISRAPPDGPGAGLGLRIINRLAEHCSVETTPGRGTQVRMSFQLGPEASGRTHGAPPARATSPVSRSTTSR